MNPYLKEPVIKSVQINILSLKVRKFIDMLSQHFGNRFNTNVSPKGMNFTVTTTRHCNSFETIICYRSRTTLHILEFVVHCPLTPLNMTVPIEDHTRTATKHTVLILNIAVIDVFNVY